MTPDPEVEATVAERLAEAERALNRWDGIPDEIADESQDKAYRFIGTPPQPRP